MAKDPNKVAKQKREARREIVAELYRKGYSIRQICKEVMRRLNVPSCSTRSVHKDIQVLLEEWRESRIEDTDAAVQLELERIDATIRELWEQWEKSKTDYSKTTEKRKGAPRKAEGDRKERIRTYNIERTETEVVCVGDVSIIAEIRHQLMERRKLLGLYAPEKREVTGKDGADLIPVDLSKLSKEDLFALAELRRKIETE